MVARHNTEERRGWDFSGSDQKTFRLSRTIVHQRIKSLGFGPVKAVKFVTSSTISHTKSFPYKCLLDIDIT